MGEGGGVGVVSDFTNEERRRREFHLKVGDEISKAVHNDDLRLVHFVNVRTESKARGNGR